MTALMFLNVGIDTSIHTNSFHVYACANLPIAVAWVTEAAADAKKKSAPKGPDGFSAASGSMAVEGANDDDWLIPAIKAAGLEFVDKRDTGGNL